MFATVKASCIDSPSIIILAKVEDFSCPNCDFLYWEMGMIMPILQGC